LLFRCQFGFDLGRRSRLAQRLEARQHGTEVFPKIGKALGVMCLSRGAFGAR
jgi:hypothetical protein